MGGQPVGNTGRQDRVDAEVPEHELHQRRHVAVIGHISGHDRIADAARREPDGQQHHCEAHRKKPGADRDDEGHLDTMHEHGHIFRIAEDCGEIEALHDFGSLSSSTSCGRAV
jgi:hypothetical protein